MNLSHEPPFVASLALLGCLLAGIGTAAGDSTSMVYIHDFSQAERAGLMQGGKNPFGLHTEKLSSGREILKADAETRFEAELQGRLRDGLHHAATVELLDALAKEPRLASRLLGAGYTVVRLDKPPRDVWDDYRDSRDGLFAGTNAALRARTENGFVALNFKPGSRIDYDNGMTHRIEAGIKIKAFVDGRPSEGQLRLFADPRLAFNPLRELGTLYPGRSVHEIWEPSADVRQLRTMYEIQLHGTRQGEMSADIVRFRDPLDHGREGTMYRLELEGDHVSTNPTAKQIASSGARPHVAADTLDPAHDANPDLIELHRLNDVLVAHLDVKPAGMAKVTEARLALGKPVAKTAAQAGTLRPSLARSARR